jgi:hypothetical protein
MQQGAPSVDDLEALRGPLTGYCYRLLGMTVTNAVLIPVAGPAWFRGWMTVGGAMVAPGFVSAHSAFGVVPPIPYDRQVRPSGQLLKRSGRDRSSLRSRWCSSRPLPPARSSYRLLPGR